MDSARESAAAAADVAARAKLNWCLVEWGRDHGPRKEELSQNTEAMGVSLNQFVGGDDRGVWCVLRSAPHRELLVCKQLDGYGIETYAPEFSRGSRTRPGSVRDRRHRWVFPGYVFFRPPADSDGWRIVRWAPGVRGILEVDGGPGALSDVVVRHLQRRIADMTMAPTAAPFKQGEPVVVERGPFAAVDAIFDCQLDSPARVQILVQMMGRELPVQIDPSYLRSLAS
jgi:transcription antitermination factor NusG